MSRRYEREGSGPAVRALPKGHSLRRAYSEQKRARAEQLSSVYFMQAQATRMIKIGYSNNVLRRRIQIQIGCGSPVAILLTMPGGPILEEQMHERFKDHRVFGEWFSPADEIMSFISRENERTSVMGHSV